MSATTALAPQKDRLPYAPLCNLQTLAKLRIIGEQTKKYMRCTINTVPTYPVFFFYLLRLRAVYLVVEIPTPPATSLSLTAIKPEGVPSSISYSPAITITTKACTLARDSKMHYEQRQRPPYTTSLSVASSTIQPSNCLPGTRYVCSFLLAYTCSCPCSPFPPVRAVRVRSLFCCSSSMRAHSYYCTTGRAVVAERGRCDRHLARQMNLERHTHVIITPFSGKNNKIQNSYK